ncbi:uncharacterized protein [Drosophila tropicalis]|uniref:uncharacterized protein n=1 Tax=Drosophila tropicalis TaxID=46794 RepID=UPI0035AC0A05
MSGMRVWLLRQLHTSGCLNGRRAPRRANPGLAYQLEQLQEQQQHQQQKQGTLANKAREDFAELESDFMNVHNTQRQHELQLQQQRDRVRQFMIKHKYFRDAKLPNLLLHAEKEQMRLLHERDPDEWTIERLAESFPATPDVVEKVLRAKWRPRSLQRIRTHDESVIRNWQQLRSGEHTDMNIPPTLFEHLQKFAERRPKDLKQFQLDDWPTRMQMPDPQVREFRQLLGSGSEMKRTSQQLEAGKSRSSPPSANSSPDEEETYLLGKVENKRKMRLQDLKKLQLVPSNASPQENPPLANPQGTGILPSFTQKFESSEIVISQADQRRYEMTRVKDRIAIPKKLQRPGATYRVDDAYYDDDGEFLYRVPGMTQGGGGKR